MKPEFALRTATGRYCLSKSWDDSERPYRPYFTMANQANVRNVSGERHLWISVLAQAIMDYAGHCRFMFSEIDKSRALTFIDDQTQDFRMVCDLAGICPDFVKKLVEKHQQIPEPFEW